MKTTFQQDNCQASRKAAKATNVACVVDLDNLCNYRNTFGRHAWLPLDLFSFGLALKRRGVDRGTVFQNLSISACGEQIWSQVGLNVVSTNENVDEALKLQAVNYTLEHKPEWLVMVANDGGYLEVVDAIRAAGITKVELWAQRSKVSRKLIYHVDRVIWIDEMVSGQRAHNTNASHFQPATRVA
jgi:hypothetical protein